MDSVTADDTMADRLEVLAYLALLSVCISWIAWKLGFYHLGKNQRHWISPISFRKVAGIYLIFLTVQVVIVPLLLMGWSFLKKGRMIDINSFKLDTLTQGWVNLFGIVLSALALGLYCCTMKKSIQQAVWGENAFKGLRNGLKDFLLGAVTWFICFPLVAWLGQSINLLLPLVYTEAPIDQVAVKHLKSTFSDPLLFWTTVLAIVFVVPVLEELLFRGFFQTWLKGIAGRMKAILGSAALFAMFHFSVMQGMQNIELVLSLFVLGCFLGYVYERQGSLWAPIGLHTTFNAVSIMMILKTHQ